MAAELTTIARPYAEAVFARAQETDKLDLWSETLELLAAVAQDPRIVGLLSNPKFGRDRLEGLLIEIGGGHLSEEGENLARLLVRNKRVTLLPEIAALYERLKNESEGTIEVLVTSAYALRDPQKKQLAETLKKRLGKEVDITVEKDPDLIGGLRIRAGDMVIDGSLKGKLRQLAGEFGI